MADLAPSADAPAPLRVPVRRLPASVLGIYGPRRNLLPERMRYLHPDGADSFLRLDASPQRPRVSDMMRSPESSLQALREKRGVQPPAFSGHNFGLSIDLDVKDCMRRWRMSKAQVDERLARAGWYCHRRDHRIASECWHYNFLGVGAEAARLLRACDRRTTAGGLEARIQELYGPALTLSPLAAQAALRRLRLYSGDLDGKLGPLSREALRIFQRAWMLAPTGELDAVTQRILAVVASELDATTM